MQSDESLTARDLRGELQWQMAGYLPNVSIYKIDLFIFWAFSLAFPCKE